MRNWKYNGTEIIETGSGARVCQMVDAWPKLDREANARLIVAAPDMYEALKEFAGYWTSPEKILTTPPSLFLKLRKALAKAEGK